MNGLIGYLFHDVILSLTRISVILKYGVSKYIILYYLVWNQMNNNRMPKYKYMILIKTTL